jgi:hypothetical protein
MPIILVQTYVFILKAPNYFGVHFWAFVNSQLSILQILYDKPLKSPCLPILLNPFFFVAVKKCVFVIRKLLIINGYLKGCFLKMLIIRQLYIVVTLFFTATYFLRNEDNYIKKIRVILGIQIPVAV